MSSASSPRYNWPTRQLARLRETLGKFSEAEPLRLDVAEWHRQRAKDSVELPESLADLGWNLFEQRKYDKAEGPLRECVKICEQKHPNHWLRFYATNLLGAVLAGQKKFAEAEPLLISGYEGLRTHRSVDHADGRPLITDALERVVQFYDAWGNKDKADEWRMKLNEAEAARNPRRCRDVRHYLNFEPCGEFEDLHEGELA